MEGELSGAGDTGPVLFEERQRFVNRMLAFVLLGLLVLVTLSPGTTCGPTFRRGVN